MTSFPETIRFEVGIYVEKFIKWLLVNYSDVFDAIRVGLLWFIVKVEDLLGMLPWWAFLLVVFLLGWRFRNLWTGLIYAGLVFLIGAFGLWDLMILTLAIVLVSVVISIILGVPLGILIVYSKWTSKIMTPILDAMQTMPSFVYLIPAIMLFRLGKVPAVFATIIYAIPPLIRLTELGINKVSREMVEASNSFGASSWQTLVRVQLPQAFPTIMTGINQTTMMALAMVVVASMIGAPGLGMDVLVAINRIDIARGFEAGLSIVFLAIIIDRLTQGIAKRFNYPE